MTYCRIALERTSYAEEYYTLLDESHFDNINEVYEDYCAYKNFTSKFPLFIEDFSRGEVLGYYDNKKLVAFSIIFKYPSQNSVSAEQFAWNYKNPKLRLGIRSLQSECARYKRLGYKYLYLGEYHEYKTKFDGFETV